MTKATKSGKKSPKKARKLTLRELIAQAHAEGRMPPELRYGAYAYVGSPRLPGPPPDMDDEEFDSVR